MGFASVASVARVRVRGLGLDPDRTHGARPSWQSSCSWVGSTPGAGTVIKLITRLQKGRGWGGGRGWKIIRKRIVTLFSCRPTDATSWLRCCTGCPSLKKKLGCPSLKATQKSRVALKQNIQLSAGHRSAGLRAGMSPATPCRSAPGTCTHPQDVRKDGIGAKAGLGWHQMAKSSLLARGWDAADSVRRGLPRCEGSWGSCPMLAAPPGR